MMIRLSILRRLRADRRGAVAAELTLMVPLLSVLLFTGMDVGRAFAMRIELEQAAQRTVELATAPGTVAKSYANLAAEAAAAYNKPYKTLVVDNWLECNGVRQAQFEGLCANAALPARYVSVVITNEYKPLFNYGGLLTGSGSGGSLVVRGDAVVRVQ